MTLEDQAVDLADIQAQIAERAAALAESPRRLWDPEALMPADQRSTTQGRE